MNSLACHLLIASTELTNDFFAQTVVLMLQHSDEGAAGIVLNKPSDMPAASVWPDLLQGDAPQSEQMINVGGPCEGPVVAIHGDCELAEIDLMPGVALTAHTDDIKSLLRRSQSSVRLFSGYAGWSPGQLENEIEQGGWYVSQACTEIVFGDCSSLWRNACDEFGEKIISPVVGNLIPADPTLN